MKRRLPTDTVLSALLSTGAFFTDIARQYKVTVRAVRRHARRLGFEPIPQGERQGQKTTYRGLPLKHTPHNPIDVR